MFFALIALGALFPLFALVALNALVALVIVIIHFVASLLIFLILVHFFLAILLVDLNSNAFLKKHFIYLCNRARRVSPAVTRLTVYRWLSVLDLVT